MFNIKPLDQFRTPYIQINRVDGKFGAVGEIERFITMDSDKIESFENVLASIMDRSVREWVYLATDSSWDLDSASTTLESDEVPPELEDEPDAGVPKFAKLHNLMPVLSVGTLQDVIANAICQKPSATLHELFLAFEFYYKHDAFIKM